MQKTLIQVFSDLKTQEWDDMPVAKHFNVEVIAEHKSHEKRWPGTQKNVYTWVELANGKAVGWNENPSKGWTFPVISLKKSV